jgi:hypothetical protein
VKKSLKWKEFFVYVSYQKALDAAIEAVKAQPDSAFHRGVVVSLEKIKKEVRQAWTKESIVEALKAWEQSHGYPPTGLSLQEHEMPSAAIIAYHFKKPSAEVLDALFPGRKQTWKSANSYADKYQTTEDWLSLFIQEFNRIQPVSADSYNRQRTLGTPRWETIKQHCGCNTWKELLRLAGDSLQPVTRQTKALAYSPQLVISEHSPRHQSMEELNQERRELNESLIQMLETRTTK